MFEFEHDHTMVGENLESYRKTKHTAKVTTDKSADSAIQKKIVFIEYRGKLADDYRRAFLKAEAPCQPVLMPRELKNVLPSLKAAIDH